MSNKLTAPVVNRNGIDKTFIAGIFGKKSKTAGAEFFYAPVTESTFDTDVAWIGKGEVVDFLDKAMRGIGAGIFLDHFTNESGELLADKMGDSNTIEAYKLDLADFTAGVAKLADIQEQVDRLQDENSALLDKAGADEVSEEDAQGFTQQILANNAKIKPLRVKIKDIQAKYAVRAAARKAKEANSPTRVEA